MSYLDLVVANQRLVILQLLEKADGYDLNSAIIHKGLNEFGHQLSADALATQLAWLQEQGLVVNKYIGSLIVAKVTQRGLDVARGTAIVPGVDRPGPEN